MLGSATFATYYVRCATGIPSLDRIGIRGRVVEHCTLQGLGLEHIRAVMAILHNESNGKPGNYLGDTGAAHGPSIGPGQVYRITAVQLGLWQQPNPDDFDSPENRDAYAALATEENEGMLVGWAVRVFADKLAQAKGDVPDAIRRYNGSGERAVAYENKALAFYSGKWGNDPEGTA